MSHPTSYKKVRPFVAKLPTKSKIRGEFDVMNGCHIDWVPNIRLLNAYRTSKRTLDYFKMTQHDHG